MIEITPEEKEKYEKREFERPVAWLVGRDLLGGLKGMALYTAYGSKLDPRDWMTGEVIDFRTDFKGEAFWFDYIADAGDGTKAMYAIAYMALSDLWRDGAEGIAFDNPGSGEELPRGQFLFVGGDTAYHNADYLTLANRIQRPFSYAFEDLKKHVNEIPQRPIFGIPGNHDYYDQVDGFRRNFVSQSCLSRRSRRKVPAARTRNLGSRALIGGNRQATWR